MTTAETTLTLDQFIRKSPTRVWAALTTPEQLGKWWAPGDIKPEVGYTFTMDMFEWGKVKCQVLEAVEPELLVYTFADWTLTWRLVPEGDGTRLVLEQSGFDFSKPHHRQAWEGMGSGWKSTILPKLATVAEED